MNHNSKILKNTFYPIFCRIIADLFFAAFYILLSRRFGREGIGVYSFSLAFAAVFFISADYGLSLYLVREVSRDKTKLRRYLGNFILLKACWSLFGALIMAALVPYFHLDRGGIVVLILLGSSQWMYFFPELFKTAFAVHEDLSLIAYSEILFKGSVFILGMLFYFQNLPFRQLLTAFPIGGLIYITSLYFLMTSRYGAPDFRPDRNILFGAIRGSFPFFLIDVLATLYFRMNPILLNFFHGNAACGLFAAPYKIVEMLMIFVSLFRASLFPVLSRLYKQSAEAHKVLVENSIKYILIFFLPISFLLFLTSKKLILALFGAAFAPSIFVLQILCIYIVFAAMRQILLAALGSTDKQWKWVASQLTGVLIGFVSGLLLIPKWSYAGAAISLAVSEASAFSMAFSFALSEIGCFHFPPVLAKPLASSGSAFASKTAEE